MTIQAMHNALSEHEKIATYWAKRWLILGVVALAISGLFAVLLAAGRAPQLKELEIAQKLFTVGLVIHVDLSVLVWFLSVIGMGLSRMLARLEVMRFPYLQSSAFWCMAIGTALMALSPLDGEWQAVKSNYIPVLLNVMFFMGLGLMAAGMAIIGVAGFVAPFFHRGDKRAFTVLWQTLAFVVLVTLAMFMANGALLDPAIAMEDRYEFIFWSGGHTLQFAYCLVAIIGWAVLYEQLAAAPLLRRWETYALSLLVIAGVLMPVWAYFVYAVDDVAFQQAFTQAMIQLGGLPSVAVIVMMMANFAKAPYAIWCRHPAATSLMMSVLLFLFGGALALMIEGQDTRIPAHYHGSIVGVTLGLMGYAYMILPKLGWADVSHMRAAIWQPVVLAIGQAMHISGLAYAGGYGVLRKQAATGVEFAPDVKAALGFMGLGGLLAIIGGFMFVLVIWRSIRQSRTPNH